MKHKAIGWTTAFLTFASVAMATPGSAVEGDLGHRPTTCSEWRHGCLLRVPNEVPDVATCNRIMAQCMKIGRWIGGGTDYGPTEKR
jgi:hypothetical protein